MILSLIKTGKISVITEGDAEPDGTIKNHISDDVQTFIKVVGLIDINVEVTLLN